MVSSRFNGSQPQYVRKHTAATVENYEKKKIANAIGCLPIPNKILFEYIVKRAVFLLKAILLFYSYHILISKTNNKKFAFLLQEKKMREQKLGIDVEIWIMHGKNRCSACETQLIFFWDESKLSLNILAW